MFTVTFVIKKCENHSSFINISKKWANQKTDTIFL